MPVNPALLDAARGDPERAAGMIAGWGYGPAAQAVSTEHLGPFELSGAVYMGARGAALTAGRAAGIVP